MKLLESRAVRAVVAWVSATLALIGLGWIATAANLPAPMVVELKAQLAQLQTQAWALVLGLILKWAYEDYAKYVPVPPPTVPQNVVGGTVVQALVDPAPPAERK